MGVNGSELHNLSAQARKLGFGSFPNFIVH
jgi:hypothetical protein